MCKSSLDPHSPFEYKPAFTQLTNSISGIWMKEMDFLDQNWPVFTVCGLADGTGLSLALAAVLCLRKGFSWTSYPRRKVSRRFADKLPGLERTQIILWSPKGQKTR